jgi:hypothetical protein
MPESFSTFRETPQDQIFACIIEHLFARDLQDEDIAAMNQFLMTFDQVLNLNQEMTSNTVTNLIKNAYGKMARYDSLRKLLECAAIMFYGWKINAEFLNFLDSETFERIHQNNPDFQNLGTGRHADSILSLFDFDCWMRVAKSLFVDKVPKKHMIDRVWFVCERKSCSFGGKPGACTARRESIYRQVCQKPKQCHKNPHPSTPRPRTTAKAPKPSRSRSSSKEMAGLVEALHLNMAPTLPTDRILSHEVAMVEISVPVSADASFDNSEGFGASHYFDDCEAPIYIDYVDDSYWPEAFSLF